MASGDRVLVEGHSGSGKSTLASLLAGLRKPDSGLLLLDGVDRSTLGERGWRRRVATVPQFQENHVINDTFAFNLLLGHRWPPSGADLARAEAVCQQLGLGDLLERMPAGLMQVVGETGWRLSHGERTRLFVARALLQQPQLLIIDESFTALDPDNLRRCLRAATQGRHALLMVAHP